jgi:hypothetical protein
MILIFLLDLELPPKYAPEMTMACRVNAASTQWTMAIQSGAMTTLAVDRVMMLRQSNDPKADTRNRLVKLLSALMWLYGTALVAPIVATSHIVGVRPFPDRLVPNSECQGVYKCMVYAKSGRIDLKLMERSPC